MEINETSTYREKTVGKIDQGLKADSLNRLVAKVIDFIIVGVLYKIIPDLGFIAGLAYLLLADGLFDGKSVGKKLIGIHVIYREGQAVLPCRYRESIFRNSPFALAYILWGILKSIPLIGGILSFIIVGVVLIFEYLVMMGSEDGTRLGDEIAKTQVFDDGRGGADDK